MTDVLALAAELVAIPSVTKDEGKIVEFVARWLVERGWNVTVQEVTPGRGNVWASRKGGGVTLSTHLDTVPPFVPPRVDDGRLYGRGSCDAKGIAAAMMAAAEQLVAEGEERVDLLFVVGEERGSDDVAIVRIEQLYPFAHKAFSNEMKKYPNATEIVWAQDEPQNQGAWFFVQHYIHENMSDGQKLGYAGRAASASPAVGYSHLHQEQQKALVDGAFGKLKGVVLSK